MKKRLSLITLAVIILVFSFGLLGFGQIGMHESDGGLMSWCIFMPEHQGLCPMGLSEHLDKWYEAFTGVTINTFYLLVTIIAIFGAVSLSPIARTMQGRARWLKQKQRLYRLYTAIVQALAGGTIQPKVYPLS